MGKYIDTHVHTNYSDGDLSPAEVVGVAKMNGLDRIAVTDHDNYRGYFDAYSSAKKWNLDLIPGVEFSAGDYHILGLGVDISNEGFQNFVDESRLIQVGNCKSKVEKMKESGVPIDFEDVRSFFREGSRLGSGNLIRYLVANKETSAYLANIGISGWQDIYPFTKRFKIDEKFVAPAEIISKIHEYGGKAFIAHPFKDVKDMKEMDILVRAGLDGVEIQPNYGDKNLKFIEYANKNNLLTTYGSDYHGPSTPKRPILGRDENKVCNRFLKN